MLRTLKRRFVLVAVLSVSALLILTLSALNIANLIRINNAADHRLEIIMSNGGFFPKNPRPEHSATPEAPYETRYFTVIFNDSGKAAFVHTESIAAVTHERATELASEALGSGDTHGSLAGYKYLVGETSRGRAVVFIDCSRDLETFREFLGLSIAVSALGITAVAVIATIFSGYAVRPFVETYEKQKRFITDASHELKTPLSVIEANAEVLELEGGESRWTESIKNQVERLTALTDDLVALSRLEEAVDVVMIDFSLSDAIYDEVAPFEEVAARSGKRLTLDIEPSISFRGDERSIRRLAVILADNALKHSSEGGEISISLSRVGKSIRLETCNTVEATEVSSLDYIFERFRRGDESRARSGGDGQRGGYGIGLSIARAVAIAHKGKISARSDDGRSVRVTVTL